MIISTCSACRHVTSESRTFKSIKMKQFKSKSLLLLFLAMRMYLEENELFPKQIEIWQKEGDDVIIANMFYCKWDSPNKSRDFEDYISPEVIETIIAPDKCVNYNETLPDIPAILLGKVRNSKDLIERTDKILLEIEAYLMEHETPDGV